MDISNLYNNNSNLNWNTLGKATGLTIATDIYGGITNGLTSYFQSKSNYYSQATQY